MVQQFRNLNFINLFYVFALTLLLRVGILINLPPAVNSGFAEFFSRILVPFNLDEYLSPLANIVVATVLVYIQATWFNQIINKYSVLGKSTFLPAAAYIVVCSIFEPFLTFTPPLLCNFLLLFIFNKILSSYKSSNSIAAMFDLGLAVALGTIFYFPFVGFLLILWIALLLFKPFSWREWVSGLVGFLTLIFILGVYYFWNDRLLDFYKIWTPLSTKLPIYVSIQLLDYIVLLPIAICVISSFYYLQINFFRSYVLVRKAFQLSVFLLALVFFTFYLKSDPRINHFLLGAIPLAIYISYYFVHAKKPWFFESLFVITLGVIIYFQFV